MFHDQAVEMEAAKLRLSPKTGAGTCVWLGNVVFTIGVSLQSTLRPVSRLKEPVPITIVVMTSAGM